MTGKNREAPRTHARVVHRKRAPAVDDETTQVTRLYENATEQLSESKGKAKALQAKMDWLLDDLDDEPTDPG